jgi:DMSO/TMAO reductase YedYZ molybdopterin-dependent catalytic subunit
MPINTPRPIPQPTQITLYPGEVLQYQGQNLDPIGSVYENAIAGTQYINQSSYKVTIDGLVNNVSTLTYDQVVSHQSYQKVVTIYCVEGWHSTILWEGILLKDLLNETGIAPGAKVIIFHASDGYSTALPLDYILQNNIILAYKMNGVPLTPELGWPFMLVAQSQYGYKWIKWITEITVSSDTTYLGYWESRGYPNNAPAP